MVEIKCRTIPKPPNGTRPVYRKNNDKKNSSKDIGNSKDEPFIQGSYGEELDYISEIVAIYLQRMFHKAKYLLIQYFSVQTVKHIMKHIM